MPFRDLNQWTALGVTRQNKATIEQSIMARFEVADHKAAIAAARVMATSIAYATLWHQRLAKHLLIAWFIKRSTLPVEAFYAGGGHGLLATKTTEPGPHNEQKAETQSALQIKPEV